MVSGLLSAAGLSIFGLLSETGLSCLTDWLSPLEFTTVSRLALSDVPVVTALLSEVLTPLEVVPDTSDELLFKPLC